MRTIERKNCYKKRIILSLSPKWKVLLQFLSDLDLSQSTFCQFKSAQRSLLKKEILKNRTFLLNTSQSNQIDKNRDLTIYGSFIKALEELFQVLKVMDSDLRKRNSLKKLLIQHPFNFQYLLKSPINQNENLLLDLLISFGIHANRGWRTETKSDLIDKQSIKRLKAKNWFSIPKLIRNLKNYLKQSSFIQFPI